MSFYTAQYIIYAQYIVLFWDVQKRQFCKYHKKKSFNIFNLKKYVRVFSFKKTRILFIEKIRSLISQHADMIINTSIDLGNYIYMQKIFLEINST